MAIIHILIWKNICIREDGLINKFKKKKKKNYASMVCHVWASALTWAQMYKPN